MAAMTSRFEAERDGMNTRPKCECVYECSLSLSWKKVEGGMMMVMEYCPEVKCEEGECVDPHGWRVDSSVGGPDGNVEMSLRGCCGPCPPKNCGMVEDGDGCKYGTGMEPGSPPHKKVDADTQGIIDMAGNEDHNPELVRAMIDLAMDAFGMFGVGGMMCQGIRVCCTQGWGTAF